MERCASHMIHFLGADVVGKFPSDVTVDLSRFDAAPLIAFIAAKETNYGTETNGRIPR